MKITAIITLHVDGKTILPGKSVDISDEEAKSLIERGFAKLAEASAVTEQKPVQILQPEPAIDDVIEAIEILNPKTDFAKNGKPKVEAIEAVLGQNISAETRDKAWELYQKELAADEASGDDVQE
jgi:hypothetical protein